MSVTDPEYVLLSSCNFSTLKQGAFTAADSGPGLPHVVIWSRIIAVGVNNAVGSLSFRV